jgi:hypothetical protein
LSDRARRGELRDEARHDAVEHRGLERETNEAAAAAVGGERAAAVGLHARLLEQRAVGGELALARVIGGGELAIALGDPQLGVLGVQDLVDRYAVGAQDRAARERPGDDRVARAEQLVAVQVDGAAPQLDVPGLGEAGADQCPHREQALEDQRPVVGQLTVDRVELAALRGRPCELGGEAHQRVTARG